MCCPLSPSPVARGGGADLGGAVELHHQGGLGEQQGEQCQGGAPAFSLVPGLAGVGVGVVFLGRGKCEGVRR